MYLFTNLLLQNLKQSGYEKLAELFGEIQGKYEFSGYHDLRELFHVPRIYQHQNYCCFFSPEEILL
jgi:hypothetical protein